MLKNFLKKHFLFLKLREQLSPAVQIAQLRQLHYYQDCHRKGKIPSFDDTGFKVFSQFEEDGKILFLFSIIGMGNKTFVDLGSNDGINSNCANLLVHFGWRGLFVDADKAVIERGTSFYRKHPNPWNYQPKFVASMITRSNVNSLVSRNGFSGEIELLSIDIDSNDYWIWKEIGAISPKVVIIESQVAFGLQNVVVPYSESINTNVFQPYYGASTAALCELGRSKGYRLVGSNQYGNNLFFLKSGIAETEFPEIPFESTLTHPWATEQFLSDAEMQKLNFA
ncbi:MAG TPA: hypothetical protein VF676_07740 [Flavobacterium sp.]|jgi:hypothetical protein